MLDNQIIIIRLLLAIILGGLVGFEREKSKKFAGFKTNILVCLGSALIAMTSTIFGGDPSRIAAQVVTGIGFIGAGTIMRTKNHVVGLTTAATLWVVSCIGLAIGIGFYGAAILTALLVFIILELTYTFKIGPKLRKLK